jgi:ribose transport system substrate-binding protein
MSILRRCFFQAAPLLLLGLLTACSQPAPTPQGAPSAPLTPPAAPAATTPAPATTSAPATAATPAAATPAAAAPAAGSTGTIGVSLLTLTNPFFKEIADSLTDEARKAGYETLVVSGEFDPAAQRTQVKDFVVKKVSAIVLTPCDSQAVGEAVRMANEANIPVFTADIACLAKDVKVVTHIATDNAAGGRQAAQAMQQALGGKGKIAIIDHPTVESSQLRTGGFKEELAKMKSEIQIIGSWAGKGSKDESFKVMQEVLQAHPDLNGIFAVNDPTALGVFAALEIARKTDQVKIIGFDGQPEGKKAIRDGKIFADPIQFPDKIGREVVHAITKYYNGEVIPPQTLIPTSLYFKADAEHDASLK